MDASLQVTIDEHPQGLRVHVRGEETFRNTVAYWQQIATRLGAMNGNGLLLIDELQGDPLSEQEWLELVLTMEYARLDRYRIAHVRPFGLREIEYCELFARDANLDAKVFVDEGEAERWLQRA